MVAGTNKPIPVKLRDDAIVEALLEIRFEMSTLPEIFFGRMAEYAPWKLLQQRRMPAYEIPAVMRQVNPQLRYQPVFELIPVETDQKRAIRIGPQVLSYHRMQPYVGWKRFKPELNEAIAGLFRKADGLTVRRLGLRYLNALRTDVHAIRSVSDLDLKLDIANERVSGNVNINFNVDVASNTIGTVRVATPEFIQGSLPANTSVYIDVDVFTQEGFETQEQDVVTSWIEDAHTKEKEQFFRLLTPQTIQLLKEEK
jgi:uncharacterized protein (TIGR04255 family)